MADSAFAVTVCCVTLDVAISIYIEGSKAILSLGPSFPVLFVTDCFASHSDLGLYTQGYSFVAQSSLSARRDWREKNWYHVAISSTLARKATTVASLHGSVLQPGHFRLTIQNRWPGWQILGRGCEEIVETKKEMTAKWHCLSVLLHLNCHLICALDTRGQKDAWIVVIYSFRSRRLFL